MYYYHWRLETLQLTVAIFNICYFTTIGIGDGGQRGHVPPKNSGKNIFGQLCKSRPFWDKIHIKFGNFVNFFGKYKKSGIWLIFLPRIVKLGHFVNFSYIFGGKNVAPPH